MGNAAEWFDENGSLSEPNLAQEVHEVVATLLRDTLAASIGQPARDATAS